MIERVSRDEILPEGRREPRISSVEWNGSKWNKFDVQIALRAQDGSYTYSVTFAANAYDSTLVRYVGSDIGQRIERVAFDDGTVWDLTQGLRATATPISTRSR